MRQVETSFLRSGNIEHIEVFAHILLRKRGKEEIYDVLSISVNQNKNPASMRDLRFTWGLKALVLLSS